MNKLIERFKNYRKRKYLTTINEKGYAFIGLGMHSLNNLLPVISYLRLNLKYIVTKSSKNAKLIDEAFYSNRVKSQIKNTRNVFFTVQIAPFQPSIHTFLTT